jgi:hypothetical protein
MSGIDACVNLLEIPVCLCLEGKRSKHEFDGNIVLVLFRFASCISDDTNSNRRQHTRNLVHGKLAADDTSNHCITTVTKMHVN